MAKKTAARKKAGDAKGISHPEKIFWPDDGYTKGDLADFYRLVFPLLRPYVADRILTMERCPDGMKGQCFYQKEKPDSLPAGTPTKRIANASGMRKSTNYVLGGDLETQLALVNLGCIPIHVCGSRASNFPKPDWVCFDLDPASGKFADAAEAGLLLKALLDELELVSFAKTSGSRGLHVFVPIKVGPTANDVLRFAEAVVARLARENPKELTVEHSIAARGKRVYLDPFRNGAVQTVVSPYSVRRKEHAPVSTPLAWSEVKATLDPASFNLGNFAKRMKKKDPWGEFFRSRQNLKAAIERMRERGKN
ncbi:MAG TPA: non-homologous end-joining DNA ligase [Candidatus Acidoferrum sp.]|nr:non-homologous end-joining DNA ligase [Candidatus Acidoferrum sp.]